MPNQDRRKPWVQNMEIDMLSDFEFASTQTEHANAEIRAENAQTNINGAPHVPGRDLPVDQQGRHNLPRVLDLLDPSAF